MNKIKILMAAIALFAATMLAALNPTMTASGAVASESSSVSTKVQTRKAWGTSVSHAADDSGYTRDIHIVCENGTHRYLGVGEDTFMGSGTGQGCSSSGVNRIIVAYNQTVYCKNYVYPYQNKYFYTGTNYVGSNQTWKCYDQWPL